MIAILSVVLFAGVLGVEPQTAPLVPSPFEKISAWKMESREKGAYLWSGDVKVSIGSDGTAILADEVESRQGADGSQMLFRGNVRLSVPTPPKVNAQDTKHLAEGGLAYRGNVRIPVGTKGAFLLADEADYRPTSHEVQLRGNVRVERLEKPSTK